MKHWRPLLIGTIGALLLITAGGWIFGIHALWAFSFLIYVPLPIRLLLGGLVLTSAWLASILRGKISTERMVFPRHHALIGLLLILIGLSFWHWREQSYHGDALLKLQLLTSQSLRTDPYIWKEPLDSFSAYTLTALGQRWGWPPATAVALLSVIAGLVYSAAVLVLIRWLASTRAQQVSYAIALGALGSSQLWFGHIENYSLVTAAAFATLVLAIGYQQQRIGLGWVGLMAGIAVSFHPQALFVMPALLRLLPRRHWGRSLLVLGSTALVAPVMTALLLWLAGAPLPIFGQGYAGDAQLFWRATEALAPGRLLDAVNNLWLVAPLFPLWLVVGTWASIQPKLRRDPVGRYLVLVTVGLLFYHLAFQNDLPRWRDWDLFALVGPGLTLWGIYSWWSVMGTANAPPVPSVHPSRWHGALWPALTFATVFTLAWVGTNHARILLRPNPGQRELYHQYRLLDLRANLADATITPDTPICAEATGCERVTTTTFLMPQDGDERPVLFAHAPVQIAWALELPDEPTFLWLSPALDPVAWGWGGDGVTFAVVVRHAGDEDRLWSRHLTPADPNDLDWQEVFVDLARYAGQSVTLILVTAPGMADNNAADRAGWGTPWLMRGTVDRRFSH